MERWIRSTEPVVVIPTDIQSRRSILERSEITPTTSNTANVLVNHKDPLGAGSLRPSSLTMWMWPAFLVQSLILKVCFLDLM